MIKRAVFLVVAMLMIVSFSAPASAAGWGWYDARIVTVGAYGGGFQAVLTDTNSTPEFSNKVFRFHSSVPEDRQKLITATMLTAGVMVISGVRGGRKDGVSC